MVKTAKPKIPVKPAIGVVLVILVLAASYIYLTTEKGAPSYSVGDRWTWQVTRRQLDPLTDNVISTLTYDQTVEYLGENTSGNYRAGIFRLTISSQPSQYGKLLRVVEGGEVRELGSESFENDSKVSEYIYSEPILLRKFPLAVGLKFSDSGNVSGNDNTAGAQSVSAFEIRTTEVTARETLMLPVAIDTYKIRTWGTSTGTMTVGGSTNRIFLSWEENLWYSESVKEAVKSTTETTTVVLTQLATSVTKTQEERVLASYTLI